MDRIGRQNASDLRLRVSFLLALLAAVGLGLSACNTFQGAGEDVEAAGETLSESAEEVEDEM